ncbi:hypothetical protein BJI69_10565 [Luteibacter rhizovicinus DSM 16549]|uniref:histidine kinase n=2 Tax=Luteibacter rhizovicinus TaxID=242606 RepID=A0A1L3ETE9_9GAMM|nr:diguanylate cyclase [Luteibacter rhizovicinus]APG04294.1 hypothetical protein BJI69_10565 [Luteibacter rhizovicinus DSM 16549]
MENAQVAPTNDELAASLREAQERARISARLLDDMSRTLGPDTLTLLPNRVLLLDRIVQAMAVARLHQCRLALLSISLDNFSDILHKFGREEGDAVLRLVAGRLTGAVGTVETVSRHGTHAFLILLPEILLDETDVIAQRVREALEAPVELHAEMPQLAVSIGVAFFPDHGQSPLELIGDADAAMRRAAQVGDRTPAIFDRSMIVASAEIAAERSDAAAGPADLGSLDGAASPLLNYLRDANEQLLLASISSLDKKELAELALHRHTDFLAVLAHELRTPLTPIGLASAMMSEVESDQIARLQGVISRQIAHISRLLTDLLEVSRFNTGKVRLKREVVPIGAVISQALDTCGPAIRSRGQTLTTALPRVQARVFGDPVRLAQVFTNLLDNASKYTPGGGTLDLRVEADAESVKVTIADNGIGISAAALPHIFEPFVQDRSAVAFNGTGLGIGLTVVRDMVEAHGGRVQVFSPGTDLGTSFEVTLTRVHDPVRRV